MKKLLFLLIAAFSLQSSFAQSETYQQKMKETLSLLDSAKTIQDMQEVAGQFERIGDMEKTQWLPYYYAALTQINIGWRDMKGDKDKNVEKANAIIKKAEAIEQNAELYVLEYMSALQQMTVDPASRYMTSKPVMDEALANARKADPNNPRIYYMEANNVFNTPAAYGGGKEKAKPLFEKCVELYKNFKPASALHPKWGQKQAEEMLAKCSS
jgi:hypothetical protein